MPFSQEFINIANVNDARTAEAMIPLPGGVRGLVSEGDLVAVPGGELGGARATVPYQNALVLKAVFGRFSAFTSNAVIYFPPGRYYVGRPWLVAPGVSGLPDLVVPIGVALRFAPGAVIVPMNYRAFSDRSYYDAGGGERSWERFKVLIDVQGTIDAGAHQIFDVLLQNLDADASGVVGGLLEAGRIHLTTNSLRAVYPEWWGASLPKGSSASAPAERAVRRTTMAIQAAIDAAHTYRASPFTAGTSRRPPIPVLFGGEYLIDRELMVGAPWWDAEWVSFIGPQPDRGRPANNDPIILRGIRAPTRTGTGAATITADARFFSQGGLDDRQTLPDESRRVATRRTPGSDALLALRGGQGSSIENLTFDANHRAARCLTLETGPGGLALHEVSVTACAFRKATRQLLHLGGEILRVIEVDKGTFRVPGIKYDSPLSNDASGDNKHWSPSQDLTGLRVTRCSFVTEELETSVVRVLGVLSRADETLSAEFSNCSFTGPAAPMIYLVGGSHAFNNCAFKTKTLRFGTQPQEPDARVAPDGLDVFLGTPPLAVSNRVSLDPVVDVALGVGRAPIGLCSMKDTFSSSPRLLADSFAEQINAPSVTSVMMVGVAHRPTIAANETLEAAIEWGAIGRAGARLVLIGCRFVRPSRARVGDVVEPVAIVYGHGVRSFEAFASLVRETLPDAVESGRGRVVDLGTKIEAPGMVAPRLVSMSDLSRTLAGFTGAPMDRSGEVGDVIAGLQVLATFRAQDGGVA
jgi:hypothetical protein